MLLFDDYGKNLRSCGVVCNGQSFKRLSLRVSLYESTILALSLVFPHTSHRFSGRNRRNRPEVDQHPPDPNLERLPVQPHQEGQPQPFAADPGEACSELRL